MTADLRHFFLSCAGALAVLAPAAALAVDAPSCTLDCEQGYVCELLPQACPLILCLDENDPNCPRCDGAPAPACVPAACESDEDCGGGTVCAEHTVFVDCAVVAPAPASQGSSEQKAAADAPDSTGCTPSVIRECTPRWQLPCETDGDCGAGFRCEEQQSCSVPPAAPTDPDSRERAADVEVTCEPSGVFACVVIETPCVSDADCPAQFVCADNPGRSCASDAYGGNDCEPPAEAKLCTPAVTAFAADAAGGVLSDAPVPNLASNRTETSAGAPDASSSAGGCAMSAPARTASFPALLGALGLAAALAGLRKRAR
jgi:hypothetical protein